MPYWDIDAAFAVMSMLLAATDAGLGALFFAIAHGEDALLSDLGVPDGYRPDRRDDPRLGRAGDPPSPSPAGVAARATRSCTTGAGAAPAPS